MFNKLSSKLKKTFKPNDSDKQKPAPFTSQRLLAWRARQPELAHHFMETLETIERVGWQTWAVASSTFDDPNFFYTVGVYDMFGLPELICVGLDANVGGSTLNYVVRQMREGCDVTNGRVKDVLGPGIDVEFHAIDPKWLHRVMLRTNWYYEGADVPVLQLVFPDLQNHFQWENDFNEFFRQPMLSPGYPPQDIEREFWDSHDMNFDKSAWKFSDPPSTKVMTTETIEEHQEPITYVAHYPDGAWMILGEKMTGGGSITSRLRRMVAVDETLQELADLPKGWTAIREAPDMLWERFEEVDEEED